MGGSSEKDSSSNEIKHTNGDVSEKRVQSNGMEQTDEGVSTEEIGKWQDAVGGATICCNLCCSTLGYASLVDPETCRLMKHRLRACSGENSIAKKSLDGTLGDYFNANTCGSFLGKELIRYAESQAVFTFAVLSCKGDGGVDRCMLLKVLSWNTLLAVKDSKDVLDFKRAVKVICEEIDAALILSNEMSNDDTADPMSLNWGGVDLCCPPFSTDHRTNGTTTVNQNSQREDTGSNMSSATRASVKIYLPEDEWKELRATLEKGGTFFSNSLRNATVLLKLGVDGGVSKENPYLSFLSL